MTGGGGDLRINTDVQRCKGRGLSRKIIAEVSRFRQDWEFQL